ncbi:hypothetical protein Y032_0006g3131 [Ancylostoma ceylanicum]|uniref:Uncharacterized protein n=1 Tax=Ancylostoma ceylanicum TaxID=53326 RepID=A0A016VQ47_9BILA|nr:hypothetical protein Y032_0006g3131 [Ancylostoma ceylanicum]
MSSGGGNGDDIVCTSALLLWDRLLLVCEVLAVSLLVSDTFAVVARLVGEVAVLCPVRSSTSEAGLISEELGILSDVHELLVFGTKFLECRLRIVLYFAKSTSADVDVFWIDETTDPYEALHLFVRDVVEFGHLVTSIDKSGVVADSLVVALCPKVGVPAGEDGRVVPKQLLECLHGFIRGDVGCLLRQDVVGETSVRGGVQLRDDETSFRGVVESGTVICDDVLVAVVPSNVQPLSGSYVNSGRRVESELVTNSAVDAGAAAGVALMAENRRAALLVRRE